MLCLQYRGKLSEQFGKSLKRIGAPCKVVFTLRKLKSVLPALKPTVDKSLKSGVIYQISCPRCNACYVGQTNRHFIARFKEHLRVSSPVGSHMKLCDVDVTLDSVKYLASSSKQKQLLILEALFIKDIKPTLNTKDEYRSHTLVIKI